MATSVRVNKKNWKFSLLRKMFRTKLSLASACEWNSESFSSYFKKLALTLLLSLWPRHSFWRFEIWEERERLLVLQKTTKLTGEISKSLTTEGGLWKQPLRIQIQSSVSFEKWRVKRVEKPGLKQEPSAAPLNLRRILREVLSQLAERDLCQSRWFQFRPVKIWFLPSLVILVWSVQSPIENKVNLIWDLSARSLQSPVSGTWSVCQTWLSIWPLNLIGVCTCSDSCTWNLIPGLCSPPIAAIMIPDSVLDQALKLLSLIWLSAFTWNSLLVLFLFIII